MNEVYRIFSNVEGFSYLVPRNEESGRVLLSLNGRLNATAIPTLDVIHHKLNHRGKPLIDGDFFALSQNVLCASEKTYSVIGGILSCFGEWFDVLADSQKFKAFHCTNMLNAINIEKCDAKYFVGTNRPIIIRKYVFTPEVVADELIFRNELTPMLDLFCTNRFKQIIEQNHLLGIEFIKLWSM